MRPTGPPRAARGRRRFLRVATTVAASGLGLGAYAWRWEPHWLEVVHRPLPIAGLPQGLIGTTLAQLSDLHVGPQVDDAYVLDTFRRVAALAPDASRRSCLRPSCPSATPDTRRANSS